MITFSFMMRTLKDLFCNNKIKVIAFSTIILLFIIAVFWACPLEEKYNSDIIIDNPVYATASGSTCPSCGGNGYGGHVDGGHQTVTGGTSYHLCSACGAVNDNDYLCWGGWHLSTSNGSCPGTTCSVCGGTGILTVESPMVMVNTGTVCVINGRTYSKVNTGFAIVGYCYYSNGNYTGPLLVSQTASAVTYNASSGGPWSYGGYIDYQGDRWYYSNSEHFWENSRSDTSGLGRYKAESSTIAGCAQALLSQYFSSMYKSDTGTICTISGRTFSKPYSGDAIVGYLYKSSTNYTGPLLVSQSSYYAAIYRTSDSGYDDWLPIGTVDYCGTSFWYSSDGYWFSGDITDTSGLYRVQAYGADLAGCANTLLEAYYGHLRSKVSFDKSGGSGGSDDIDVVYSLNLETITIPYKTGYTFAGYYNYEGTKQYYTSSGTSARTYDSYGDATLYAHWTPNTYTIVLNGNGGLYNGSSTYSQTVTYNTAYTISNLFERTGYSYTYWNSLENNTGTSYSQSLTAANINTLYPGAGQTVNLYAQWSPNTYTVTFNLQSGTGGTATIYEKYNTGYYLDASCSTQMTTSSNAITTPTRTNCYFAGYYTSANGGGTQYIDSSGKLTSSASLTQFSSNGNLYAFWIYKITLDGALCDNTGTKISNATEQNTRAIYSKYNIGYYLNSSCSTQITTLANAITIPKLDGYTFMGYYTSMNGGGTQFIDENGYLISSASTTYFTSPQTLYAKWVANTLEVDITINW